MGPYPTADHSNDSTTNAAVTAAPASSNLTSLEEGSSSRSFFSRFSLLRSRARHIADFHIRPAEPHRKYVAGDHVQGAVILTVVKPVRITHLTVALHGYVRVYKNPSGAAANEAAMVNPAEIPSTLSGNSRFKYYGNGHASLFQDEQVLSSDGRLDPGKYEFNFDLLFPSKGLPSSIDFERGTISYMVTATLTRPTSITPTMSCERKVDLVEKVDVGFLTPPRPRTIYLEPISKRSKKKRPVKTEKAGSEPSHTPDPASEGDSTRANENSTEGSLSVVGEDNGQDPITNVTPGSPVQSDVRSISGESAVSGSTGLNRDPSHLSNSGTIQAGGNRAQNMEDRTITATIELLKGGCLPGDTVSVKISVQHIRRIKSMHGVIVTLFRQGRIDSAPSLSLFKELSAEDAKKLEKEEYYPKSRTGLGGLSLSSAGSCSVFRKDLSQTFAPLLIDPLTFTASLTASVKVPVNSFPTIKGVPGEMIAFKYQLEVIVDLGGKLANLIQGGNSSAAGPGVAEVPTSTGNPYEKAASLPPFMGNSIINTDPLRRQKGVIAVVFELVVGTTDTSRQRGRAISKSAPSIYTQQYPASDFQNGMGDEKSAWPNGWHGGYEDDAHGQSSFMPEDYTMRYDPYPQEPPQRPPYWNHSSPLGEPAAPEYVPPPNLPDESELSEKERIRRAEQRLLPSQPPGEPIASGSGAPSYPDNDNIYDADDGPSTAPPPPISSSLHTIVPFGAAPSAPTLDDLAAGTGANATDDKQELERQRLMAEASAPPEFPEDYETEAGQGSSATAPPDAAFQPSAPVLTEEDEYGASFAYNSMAGPSHGRGLGAEPLPKYER